VTEQFRVEPLSRDHDRSRFSSGSAALDRYFHEQASQDTKRRIATCFVAVSVEAKEVAGFYTLTATSVALSALAADIIKKLPRYPVVPAALLGRLAVAQNYQGKGLGGVLLGDAVLRTRGPNWVCSPCWSMPKMNPRSVFTNTTDLYYCRAPIGAYVFQSRWRYGSSKGEQNIRIGYLLPFCTN
jgi:GNAT superfamily N-acetyltransferase